MIILFVYLFIFSVFTALCWEFWPLALMTQSGLTGRLGTFWLFQISFICWHWSVLLQRVSMLACAHTENSVWIQSLLVGVQPDVALICAVTSESLGVQLCTEAYCTAYCMCICAPGCGYHTLEQLNTLQLNTLYNNSWMIVIIASAIVRRRCEHLVSYQMPGCAERPLSRE